METTVDRFGRVLIPKRVRDHFGLTPGTVLKIETAEDGIRLSAASEEGVLAEEDGVLVFLGRADGEIAEALAQEREARLDALLPRDSA